MQSNKALRLTGRVAGGLGMATGMLGGVGAVSTLTAQPAAAASPSCGNGAIDVCVTSYVSSGKTYWQAYGTNYGLSGVPNGILYLTEGNVNGTVLSETPLEGFWQAQTRYTPGYLRSGPSTICAVFEQYDPAYGWWMAYTHCGAY